MTREQIKQNAEEYILKEYSKVPALTKCAIAEIFAAGAHSRDEEIGIIEGLLKIKEHEIKQLRNPWISVEERLPDDMQNVIWVHKYGQYFFGYFHKHDNGRLCFVSTEAVTDVTGEWRDRVTHWMPIPELPKGGEK